MAGGVVQSAAQQAEQALTQWVVDTAVWLLNQLANVVLHTASPNLTADWWRTHYADMVAVAWVVAPLFLILGIVQAIIRADLGVLGRILAQLAVVALFTAGAVALAQMLISVVDQLSDFVARNSQADLQHFLNEIMAKTMSTAMTAAVADPATATTTGEMPLAFLFLTGVLTVIGGVLIWLELLARTLVIYAALLFFPILLAAALWPRLSNMAQMLAEILVAVIVSKFVIVVIVVAGVAALNATGTPNAGPSLLVGGGILLLAAWAPWKLYRLLPAIEAAMVHQVRGQFDGGWARARTRGQQLAGRTMRSPAAPKQPLKVAGMQAAAARGAGRVQTAGAAVAGAATAGAATVARTAAAGAQAVRSRVVPGGAGAPRGWNTVQVEGGGRILIPGNGVRNPRPSGGAAAGGGSSG